MRLVRLVYLHTLHHFQLHQNYRLGAILWIINGLILPFTLMGVWLTAAQFRHLPYNQTQIISYYLFIVLITRLTQTWTAESLSRSINLGTFANHLILPSPFWVPQLGRDMGTKTIRLLTLIPYLLLVFLYLGHQLFSLLSFSQLVLFALSIIIGYSVNFLIETIIGLGAIWFEQSNGFMYLFWSLGSLVTGSLIPLAFMPQWLSQVIKSSPFRYSISLPLEILINHQPTVSYLEPLILGLIWVIVLLVLTHFMYQTSIKSFTAVGT